VDAGGTPDKERNRSNILKSHINYGVGGHYLFCTDFDADRY